MKYILVLCFGIFLGWKLNNHTGQSPLESIKAIEEELKQEDLTRLKLEVVDRDTALTSPTSPVDIIATEPVKSATLDLAITNRSAEITKIEPEKTSTKLSLDLTEQHVQLLEKHLKDLRESTSTSLSELGWKVKFHDEKNYFRLVGIRNEDVIKADTIETLKLSPKHAALILRFERVLKSLEE